ncbi:AbrB/MazE/SpoVT family DNA-binding domain-containing protein [Sandaracinobacter neustonicus]|uniref:AbrB/MazE/SpoVT family DNA-binding domain-containing protein n=1 Tax=Sandaracinobacter neustonicus TaxID=1715348 RepID=A0A501XKH1_9SPHN|nr:AbrB/MazE/SpoVT family DNA-binding domain-containing protein [Sandaracinobacter neustonicus]TPE61070.1 AbrB/MazE/SpoVT family DNA-binding domain-containing protein [Sandaracinobacter neustonicus]
MQIARWGNSLAVRIPADVARALGIKEGDDVDVTAGDDGTLVLAPRDRRAAALAEIRRLARPLPADWKIDFETENLRGPDIVPGK